MRITLVRHAAVETDPEVLPSLWQLSDEGRSGARALAQLPLWRRMDRIFTSPESKALETAHILAGPNGLTVTVVEDLHEVERPDRQWFEDYPAAVREYLSRPDDPTHGWETPRAAQQRMTHCIETLRTWESTPFAIAGHGLTLSLFIAAVTGLDARELWPTIGLPDFAVVDLEQRRLVQGFGVWRG